MSLKRQSRRALYVTKMRADGGSMPRGVPEASLTHSGGSGHPPEALFGDPLDAPATQNEWLNCSSGCEERSTAPLDAADHEPQLSADNE